MTKPYKDQKTGKKEQVALMFNNIARRYDFLNHFLSLGIDKIWRKKAVNTLSNLKQKSVLLDIACGTGDLSIEALKLNPEHIIGIDISDEMLKIGTKKVEKIGASQIISLRNGDAENMVFKDNSFDAITVAFGVRNFEDLSGGLSEIWRVLKPGGHVVVLEFSKPHLFPVKQIYQLYFNVILPVIGKIFSKDQTAYSYLPQSVNRFPEREHFTKKMEDAGFSPCIYRTLTFGIATIYYARKKEN